MNFDDYLQVRVDAVNRYLQQLGDGPDFRREVPSRLREAMNYSLLSGGKRIRPVLTLMAAEAVSGQWERWLPFAAAIELVHTYSLIHDDLPAMDDDDFRRGRPTNHKVFGEAMAILAGDALLTHAFTLMARSGREQGVDAAIVLQTMEELSHAAGPAGMVGGQVLDLSATNTDPTTDVIRFGFAVGRNPSKKNGGPHPRLCPDWRSVGRSDKGTVQRPVGLRAPSRAGLSNSRRLAGCNG